MLHVWAIYLYNAYNSNFFKGIDYYYIVVKFLYFIEFHSEHIEFKNEMRSFLNFSLFCRFSRTQKYAFVTKEVCHFSNYVAFLMNYSLFVCYWLLHGIRPLTPLTIFYIFSHSIARWRFFVHHHLQILLFFQFIFIIHFVMHVQNRFFLSMRHQLVVAFVCGSWKRDENYVLFQIYRRARNSRLLKHEIRALKGNNINIWCSQMMSYYELNPSWNKYYLSCFY